MQGYRPSSYGDGFAEVYDDWYPADEETDAAVAALHSLAAGGRVLELGCGTGRLCLPLAARGLAVFGLDASPAMLDRLRAKDAAGTVTVVAGDMTHFDVAGSVRFRLVFAAFNTFFNLATDAAQRSCLASVVRHLEPAGTLALECFVPGEPPSGERDKVELRALDADRVVLRVSRLDPSRRTVSGQHVELSEARGVRLRPWHLHYSSPADLDRVAAEAGLVLAERWADWSGGAFTEDAPQHVSLYRLAGGPAD